MLDGLHAHGITPLVTIWGSPSWSNGGHAGELAAAERLRRTSRTPRETVSVGPSLDGLERAEHRGLLASGLADAVRAEAAESGVRPAASRKSQERRRRRRDLAPLDRERDGAASFMQGMRAAHARLDAYAANPYPSSKLETPFFNPCSWCQTLTMARLPQIRSLVTKLFGRSKPLWLTEYGVPDESARPALGVSPARQAQTIGQAALRVWEQPGAIDPHPLPRPGRAADRRVAERSLHRRRRSQAREERVCASARAESRAAGGARCSGARCARAADVVPTRSSAGPGTDG